MKRLLFLLVLGALVCLNASTSLAAVYMIDADHSSIVLNVTHLGIGTVQGRFDRFSGTFNYDSKDVAASKVSVNIDASSINTNQELRDKHLVSADFLDVRKYPEIQFETTGITTPGGDDLKLAGNLSLHGVTRPIVLLATFRGTSPGMDGKNRIAFTATAQINRKDYGIVWNQIIGSSSLVGQMVEIYLNIEGMELTQETR